jgi:catechol 2,3-dioxygenase
MTEVRLAPRRLGHVNLWVSDLERSILFYQRVCGIELVRRERDIKIAFHSNGNTHHDIGIIEISRGADRYGRNGTLQIPKHRGTTVGLNHLGWEMENERELVAAYRRALDAKVPIARTMDHLISHSIYLNDPDGNSHEFYADQMTDWRSVYNLDREDEVSGDWDPLAATVPAQANYNVDPPIRRVEDAPVHPASLTDVVFATRQFDAMRSFLENVAGLTAVGPADGNTNGAVFAGAIHRPDLVLIEAGAGEPVGLRSFTFTSHEPIVQTEIAQHGIASEHVRDERGRDVVRVRDPDGFDIRFAARPASATA